MLLCYQLYLSLNLLLQTDSYILQVKSYTNINIIVFIIPCLMQNSLARVSALSPSYTAMRSLRSPMPMSTKSKGMRKSLRS